MGAKTAIEYADSTDNPVVGCSGCELYHPEPGKNRCYAATLCNRRCGMKGWPQMFTQPEYYPHRIEQALGWKDLTGTDREDKPWLNGYPRVVFVNDLGDGFCPGGVDPNEWLTPWIERMEKSPHIWLILTKWPWRMAGYFDDLGRKVPDNFWLGTSVLSQSEINVRRVRALLEIPCKVRWLSMEPMLGPPLSVTVEVDSGALDPNTGVGIDIERPLVDWIVGGGESGINARPTHPNWPRAAMNDCLRTETPWFWKQWGEWLPVEEPDNGVYCRVDPVGLYSTKALAHNAILRDQGWQLMKRVGKKAAGRLLDGVEWVGMPDWNLGVSQCQLPF